ncbi:dicer-like endonuclease [Cryphonectria parasitica EP155]|uniref:Dicer-like protein 2 n=2 Tax=Cryphonectria parasitica TaxID=5116 RepID=DCL2_CRYPA|nr:dicer-like endonuclease [Cryphonectria parasitica EP155]Q2VF18.1 RecName: Full=Dicer-like protein 2; Includes: RecName: Full=Endoribonuclease DCL-2; Includes: RecName: Full=ATP-dependent helicase DCL-2 [Cryphonectria parasitica]ABB00357.1 dicer-like protein 2 [Cryphonectria parasitica]KAF3765860.1 dicer-like endonuclease [Cryphonectria parasitica EP155]
MAYYTDSSSSESEDFEDVINQVVAEEDITGAAWYDGHLSEEDSPGGKPRPKEQLPKDIVKMDARAYQLEMLEASLKENIICAMDTGSGKTHVAILRIKAELEEMPEGQVVWFLTPTVSLCAQQYAVVKAQIPSVQTKIVTGADKVDSWSSTTWDGALLNVKVIITTPQVLLDALLHGFVNISSLALMVFDEAHHCNKNHAYSRVMKEFYWESKTKHEPVPRILGLTASPVVRSDISSLKRLESTLDAVCRSPTRHREELIANSQRPALFSIIYNPKLQPYAAGFSESLTKLMAARNKLNILEDPYVVSLRAEISDRSRRKLEKAIKEKRTYVQDTMKSFCRRSMEMAKELGAWAADWFISEAIRLFLAGIYRQGASSKSFRDAEVIFLARVFQDANIEPPPPLTTHSGLSEKVQRIIEVLLNYDKDARAICFVKERATTVVLSHILTTHPEVSSKFRIGTMVGTSFVPGVKRDFLDLPETGGSQCLEAFREGRKNMLVATSVLEEGIDVPACNLIICFDKPNNLRAFIQRRGRARMRQSHLYLFVEDEAEADWEALEAQMKLQYEDEKREHERLEAIENSEALDYPEELRVESTGARLTINDAKSHLQHFVSTLASRKFVQTQPDYLIEKVSQGYQPGDQPLLKATVLLPVSVPQALRQVTSSRTWVSEKNACMDAAFQAYKALYEAGLVDDHLLPLRDRLELELEVRPGMREVRGLYNPWLSIAAACTQGDVPLCRRALKVSDGNNSELCEFELAIPVALPEMKPMVVWWDHRAQLTLRIDSDAVMADTDVRHADQTTINQQDHTSVLLSLAYGHRNMTIRDDCILRLVSKSGPLSMEQLGQVEFAPGLVTANGSSYLVRDERDQSRHPYYFESVLPSKPPAESIRKVYRGFDEDPTEATYLSVRKWPKKTGFFHRPCSPQHSPSTKPYAYILPAETTTVDRIPLVYAQMGLLMPSLVCYTELYLVAAELSRKVLAPLRISNVSMLVEAICAKSARTPENYERIEFLGDSILKTCITVNLAATKLHLPEGILSLMKDRLVSNARLCRAACDAELDQFLVTQQLVTKGWQPPYMSDLAKQDQEPESKRILSPKTLADVVEALIGVSFVDGGLPKALECIRLFIPESQPRPFSEVRDILFGAAEPKGMKLPADLQLLEQLIEYSFCEKALLVEAVTHPSYNVSGTVACYDRLEFIGDAILDYIIVEEVFALEPALENWQMHLLRTALVNADILGFLIMEWSYKQMGFEVCRANEGDSDSKSSGDSTSDKASPRLEQTEVPIPLWSFMRQSSAELTMEREITKARFEELRDPILEAMRSGTHYPWALFARLHAQKFYSDFFEALVGAIWVDAGPGFDACRAFVARSGVLPYLKRLLRDQVHVLHPKEELGRLAGRERVEYVVKETLKDDGDGKEWACEVRVGGRYVTDVTGCLFKEESRVKAATQACEILKRK